MAIGGHNSCPIALGGDAFTGWTAEQQSRAAADLRALALTAPFARINITGVASPSGVTINAYTAQHGSGVGVAPTATRLGSGRYRLLWPGTLEDAYGNAWPVNLRGAKGSALNTGFPRVVSCEIFAPNDLRVYIRTGPGAVVEGTASVTIW
jgi:hypothetical protein